MDDRVDLLATTRATLLDAAHVRLGGAAARHAPAVHRRAHRNGTFAPELDGAGPADADRWRAAFRLDLPTVTARLDAPGPAGGSTAKAVLRLGDGRSIETVRVPIGDRRESQCVSTQVGCGMACRFCETARMGLVRSLTAGEIVGQVVAARATLGWRPASIVFQGMGEPLDDADALIAALRALTDPNGLAFARDRLTVCTVGHVDGLRRLATLGWSRLGLSLSLTAADDGARRELVPIARRWPLAEVQRALIELRGRRNWQLGIHWCLLPGVNDRREDARKVAMFCAPLGRVMVHVIPYNPGSVPLTRPPTDTEVARFVGWLRDEGLPVRRRITKGRELMAACGQLATDSRRGR
ncbi:MAG: radical SAM protein [Planctomycetes bacterium]|nr:radical SAM protein [Planctomycetota bacterium]